MLPVDGPALLAAFSAGLLGSVHCVAMCGGIATGLVATRPQQPLRTALEINAGRVAGYILAGLLVGTLGAGLLGAVRIPEIAVALRMLAGGVLVLVALRLLNARLRLAWFSRASTALWMRLRPLQRRLLPADRCSKRIALGMLWGWMPCGLSVMMLTAAWLQGDPLASATTMAAFGAGTLVTMLPLSWTGARVARRLQGPLLRPLLASVVLLAALLTATAPLLAQLPGLHGPLSALGCLRSA